MSLCLGIIIVFYKLIKKGWIHEWRPKSGNQAAMYELTYKAKRMVSNVYSKLNGEDFLKTQLTILYLNMM